MKFTTSQLNKPLYESLVVDALYGIYFEDKYEF